ncbi:MAG: hypothetical protein K2J16_06150 [Clostridia bacterium]|nr:hypothetical protein [Clostridia bacterium]
MGLFNSKYTTVKVSGSLTPILGKNVEQKKAEKIAEMESQGYTLVSCTGLKHNGGGGFITGFMGGNIVEYTLVFEKP